MLTNGQFTTDIIYDLSYYSEFCTRPSFCMVLQYRHFSASLVSESELPIYYIHPTVQMFCFLRASGSSRKLQDVLLIYTTMIVVKPHIYTGKCSVISFIII